MYINISFDCFKISYFDATSLRFIYLKIMSSVHQMHVLLHRFSFPSLMLPKHGSGSPGILLASSFLDIPRGSEVWMQRDEHNRRFASLTEEFGVTSVWLQETEALHSHGNRRQTHACMIYRLPRLLSWLDNITWCQFWKICLKYSTGCFVLADNLKQISSWSLIPCGDEVFPFLKKVQLDFATFSTL